MAFSLAISALSIAVLAILTAPLPIERRATFRLWLICAICLGALIFVAWTQSLRFPTGPDENPAWAQLRGQLGPVAGAISVIPEQTRASIVAFAPLLLFLTALRLFQSDADAIAMLRRLVYFSTVVAIYGLAQFLLFPGTLLFRDKQFYIHSLTAVFINQNTAGTFFGVGFLASTAFIVHYLEASGPMQVWRRLLNAGRRAPREHWRALAFCSSGFLHAVALFLTQSRGAVGATFLAVILFLIIAMPRRQPTTKSPMRIKPAYAIAVVCAVFVLFAVVQSSSGGLISADCRRRLPEHEIPR